MTINSTENLKLSVHAELKQTNKPELPLKYAEVAQSSALLQLVNGSIQYSTYNCIDLGRNKLNYVARGLVPVQSDLALYFKDLTERYILFFRWKP